MLVRDEAEYYQLCFAIKSFEKSLFTLIDNGVEIVKYIDFNEDTDVDDTVRSFIGMRVLYPLLELIKCLEKKDDKIFVIVKDLSDVVQSQYIEIRKYSSFATYTLNLISYIAHTSGCKLNDTRRIILNCYYYMLGTKYADKARMFMYYLGRKIPFSLDEFIRQFNAWCVAKSYDINLSYKYIPADYKFQLRNEK
jgi:hypothetical protein